MEKTFNKAVEQARIEYLKYCECQPRQFNIQKFLDESWKCEFIEEIENWNECTRWVSGDNVIRIFFSSNPFLELEEIDSPISNWEDSWTKEK